MPLGPVQQGLAARMGGGAPAPPPGMGAPPGMEGGGDPVEEFAMHLAEARMAIGRMGPQRWATEGKDIARGFIGSVTQLQAQMGGGQGAPPPGPPVAPPGPPPGAMGQPGPPGPPMGY